MTWAEYVARHSSHRSQTELAALVGVSSGAISRWINGGQGIDGAKAIQFARAVGDPPLVALVEAGLLTQDEANMAPPARLSLDSFTTQQLADEVARRVAALEGAPDEVWQAYNETKKVYVG